MSAWIDYPQPVQRPRRAPRPSLNPERPIPAPTPATIHHLIGGALPLEMLAGAQEAVGAALPGKVAS